jgi:hypothetical protein
LVRRGADARVNRVYPQRNFVGRLFERSRAAQQFLLSLLVFGDVANPAQRQLFFTQLYSGQDNSDGKFRSVLAERKDLEPMTHGTPLEIVEISRTVGAVPVPKAVRQQPFESLPGELVMGIAEHPFRAHVGADDSPVGVCHKGGTGHEFQNLLKAK